MARARTEDLARRSHYIFQGRIVKLAATTESTVTPSSKTAVVRVERVLKAPENLDDFTDRDVTVELATTSGAKRAQRAVFFTTSWVYGESLALVEVGRMPSANLDRVRKQIAEAEQAMADDALRARLRRANLVIVGRVVETQEAKPPRRLPITEHAPEWAEAVVEVEEVEKGRRPDRRFTVLFPRSTDEMWIDSPKFERGQDGIWILQRNQKERGWPLMRVPGLTALDPLDFQPRSELDRIRALLKRPR